MKTELIPINNQAELAEFSKLLGVTVTHAGGICDVEIEGRDEQRYVLRFSASAQPVYVNGAAITPKATLLLTTLRVVPE